MARPAFLHPFARPADDESRFLTIVRGEGARVVDATGRHLIDATASLWYCQVGHGRREIADAVHDQLLTLDSFHNFDVFTNQPADELCRRLAALAPIDDARIFLTNSGSEAVDTALKLARLTFDLRGEPHRHLIVGRRHAYHGVTYGGLSVMGLPANAEGWGPLVGGSHAIGIEHDDLAAAEALFASRGDEIAAVIAEPVIGAGGVRPAPPGYLAGLRRLCDEHGALLILDDVICAFGRLGHWWGAEHDGVRADLITFAKGVTSGYQPLGGVVVGPAVLEPLEAQPDFVLRTGHTYSGHPASCRAALANLDIIEQEELLARAVSIGALLGERLQHLRDDDLLAEVRGVAAIWGADLPDGVSAPAVRDTLLDLGVVVRPLGATTLALCPPLVITTDELDQMTTALRRALEAHAPPRDQR